MAGAFSLTLFVGRAASLKWEN